MQVRSQPHNLYLVAFAAIAPAAAPIANHFAARAILRSTEPPFAARRASSRSLLSAWLFTFSSARSACAAPNFARQALQSAAKSYRGFKSAAGKFTLG